VSARPKDKLSSVETEDGALKGRRYREPKAREGDLTGRLQDLYDLCAEVALIRSACSGKWLLSGGAGVLWLCTEQCAGAIESAGLVCLEANRNPRRFACC